MYYVFIISRENENLLSMRSVHKNIKNLKSSFASQFWTHLKHLFSVTQLASRSKAPHHCS